MRKLLLAGVLGLCASQASAAVLIYEPFNYTYNSPNGDPIQGNTPAVPGTQTWLQAGTANPPQQIRVASGNLAVPSPLASPVGNSAAITGGAVGNGAANRLGLGSTISADGSNVYFSFPLRIDALTGSNSVIGGFFIGLNNSIGTQTGNPSAVVARVQARIDPTDPTKYNLGIFRNIAATAGAPSWSGPLTVGDTHFIVASVEIVTGAQNDVARMWIDPSPSPSAPAATLTDSTTGTGTDFSIASIILRQTVAPYLTLDELRVGTEWGDVAPIPEPASLAALGLGGIALLGRRRRR